MKPSLVLWDWNGTLLDDVALCVDALNRLLRRRYTSACRSSSLRAQSS